ncbi:MAG: RNA helicase [Planctomycetota bacterium]|nr:MAG: RNA helicase [Planctomycetota bacterium]
MNVFDLRRRLVEDYDAYTQSFIKIADAQVDAKVKQWLNDGALWPAPLLQLNPTFRPGGRVEDLVAEGTLHQDCSRIFAIDKGPQDHSGRPLVLHQHQTDAIRKARDGKSYVLTSGTGSGKSLTYIIPIVDHVLRRGAGRGIQAIVVYPMNALANSQAEELGKFLGKDNPPVRFARFTGQEKGDERNAIRSNPPDVLLTNYMMLELLLTRTEDRELVRAAQGLRFLVFDELHTYRGRQGADIAMLIRRCRLAFGGHDIICIGTSATMASQGSSTDQKREVAKVATTLFGTPFDETQVIGETLERATPERSFADADSKAELTRVLDSNESPPDSYAEFCAHPLASWIESTFGVRTEPDTGRCVRQAPRPLEGEDSASASLSELTGIDRDNCEEVLRRFLLRGSTLRRSESSRFPVFAFRLHQFLTRGDTVWTTMEPRSVRHLEMSKQVAKPGEPDKPMFPLVFCRQCGCAYCRVSVLSDKSGRRLLARDDRPTEKSDDRRDGYLYISEGAPWPDGEGQDLLERLPAFLKETTARGVERVRPDARTDIPEAVWVAPDGRVVSEGNGMRAALIVDNFLFCLDPGCGVAYTKSQRSERAKLGTLGVDNRSTATTVLAVRALIELQGDTKLEPQARKLLSFTDNRQDASLQAGHFNDFAQVALLRSALFKAASGRGLDGLRHAELSRGVFDALSLRFDDYAADPDVRGPARHATNDALRRVIDYYLYRDLQRGWRVTAPNLEDCGLLRFEYEGLSGPDGLLSERELWEQGLTHRPNGVEEVAVGVPDTLRVCTPEVREEIVRTLLDILRRSLAVKVDVLDFQKQRDLVEQTNPRLLEGTVWHLEDNRELTSSVVAYPRPKQGSEYGFFVSSYGGFGRYVRRTMQPFAPAGQALRRDDVDAVIRYLFLVLRRYGILEQVRSGDIPGYQINHDALRWIAGTGTVRPVDRTRLIEAGEIPPEVNEYFVDCYKGFVDLKCLLEAREHTAQVASEDRVEREDRFRSADLPLLFCSPTMELGVDIAQLNVVNLRNVPPTPANYAQRSGRAGRGGQPALVYTYCAGRSPHDQYYFRKPTDMVAGSVAPPRIDLCNRDLVKAHVHAVWMEVAKPDLGKTLTGVLDVTHEDGKILLPVKEQVRRALVNPASRATALERANKLVDGIRGYIAQSTWFHNDWTREILDQLERSFDSACERWRDLYRSAVRQRELHHRIIGDHSRPESERAHSRRLRAQAESQIKLLTEAEGIYEGDFYSYRYLAAEGFLPGYNFPRLPLSAFVPARRGRKGRDEFVSRPRFLAISEFGPRALIYHEGARYRVYKVNLDFGSESVEDTRTLPTATMKRCERCGYAHLEHGANLAEVCERCGAGLGAESVIQSLVQLQNVSVKLAQRITCDEEERKRFGYRIKIAYRFPDVGGKLDRRDAEVLVDSVMAMRVSYGDSATLYRINLGWATQCDDQPPGFLLDLERGYWATNAVDPDDAADANAGGQVRVVPFVTDTKNALVMRFEPTPSLPVMASLQAVLKQAVQQYFQLEGRELACEAVPSSKNRNEILFYEASEGGAGVLRQIVDDPTVIPAVARTALALAHFDPDTLHDLGSATCGKACYSCLLDYGNQPDHHVLDRFLVRDILKQLTRAVCKPAGGIGSRAERMLALRKRCDSSLEKKWLDQLDALSLTPPSDAQFLIEVASTRPDFYYADHNVVIYIDGPPHDTPEQIRADEAITRRLQEMGYVVIRFHHKNDWAAVFRGHPDVFGKAKA